jgi:hypothetical protein
MYGQVKLYLLFSIYCNFQIQWHVMKIYIWKCSHKVSCVVTLSCRLTLYNMQAHDEQHEEQCLFSSRPCKLILTNHHQYTVRGTIDGWLPSKYIYFLSMSLFIKIAINILPKYMFWFACQWDWNIIFWIPFPFTFQWNFYFEFQVHWQISPTHHLLPTYCLLTVGCWIYSRLGTFIFWPT